MDNLPDAELPEDPSAELLLLAAIADGDVQAMARLIRLHSELVYSVARRILQDSAAAEDVMQQVFLQIWREPTLLTTGSVRSFLALTARNMAVDLLRKQHPSLPVDEILVAPAQDLLESTDRNLILQRVRAAMKDLPPEQSRALDMAFFSGCTANEIAAVTASPLGTVRARVKGALNAIGKALGR